jgi:DNA-binding ferritin-like protein (Dps family)
MIMLSKFMVKVVGEKSEWRAYKARARQLPANYRMALEALERYLNYTGTGGDATALYGNLVNIFEQGAADGTPIRQLVGQDPVEFIATLVHHYPTDQWLTRERRRLVNAIDRAATERTV